MLLGERQKEKKEVRYETRNKIKKNIKSVINVYIKTIYYSFIGR